MSPPSPHSAAEAGKQPQSESFSYQNMANALPSEDWQTAGPRKRRRGPQGGTRVIQAQEISDEAWAKAKAEADTIYAAIDAKKAKRKAEQQEPLPVFTHPGSDDVMDISGSGPSESFKFDYKSVRNPKNWLKAAVRVEDLNVVGNAYAHREGYAINAKLDGGRLGEPSITLVFNIFKKNPGQEGFDQPEERYRFAIEFKFNVIVGQLEGEPIYSVEGYGHCLLDLTKEPAADNPELVGLWEHTLKAAEGRREHVNDRFFLLGLCVNSFRVTEGLIPVAKSISDPDLRETIARLVSPDPKNVLLWVVGVPDSCLEHLQKAFEMKLPPLSQYYGKDGQPVLSIKETPLISEVGDGMYVTKRNDPKRQQTF